MFVKGKTPAPQGYGYYLSTPTERPWARRLVLVGVALPFGVVAAVAGFLAVLVL